MSDRRQIHLMEHGKQCLAMERASPSEFRDRRTVSVSAIPGRRQGKPKYNTVQKVAAQRKLPGECLQDAGSLNGMRRRDFTGRSLSGVEAKRAWESALIAEWIDVLVSVLLSKGTGVLDGNILSTFRKILSLLAPT